MAATVGAPVAAATPRSGGAAGAGGLVPYKTSVPEFFIPLDANAQADARVRRLKRSVWASGHLHALADNGFRPAVCWFVTLTYRGVDDWRADHIKEAVNRFRKWCKRVAVPCRYTWVAELQQRGAVHYHLLAWLPVGVSMPFWDKAHGKRAAFWPHGWSNTEKARAGVGYLMKYLSKLGTLSRFPKGLRLYGIGGLSQDGRSVRAWFNLPAWAKRAHGVGELARCAGRLVVRATGEILEPVYRVRFVLGALVVSQLREVASRFGSASVPLGQCPGVYSAWPRECVA